MLELTKKECKIIAESLGDYSKLSIDELANGYCAAIDAKDTEKKNAYIAALMLRFWYKIDRLNQSSQNINLEYEDFFTWLYEGIEYACKYRAWQTKEGINAQQAINKCIDTIRLQHYYEVNLDKHKASYNNISLETPLSSGFSDDAETTLGDTIEADEDLSYSDLSTISVIQSCIDKGKLLEAVIADTIAFADTPAEKLTQRTIKTINENGEEEKYVEHYREFWGYMLVKNLNNLPEDYADVFSKRYAVNTTALNVVLAKIKKSTNNKLYKYIDNTRSWFAATLAR